MANSFAVVFVGERCDITQLATANLTAKYDAPFSVGIGSLLAESAVAGLAIVAGSSPLKSGPLPVVLRHGRDRAGWVRCPHG